MRIYLAGPMSGLPEYNFPAFHNAAKLLRQFNHEVFSPAETGIEQEGHFETGDKSWLLRKALAQDIGWIIEKAEAIYMLKGWENSKGARAEWAVALALGLKIMYELN